MLRPAKVLIVDDSALMRQLLSNILARDPALEVVGTARDPIDARQKIKDLRPDVLTLDIEMPRMDGLTFLSNLMRLRPMPVVMVSSLTENGADATLAALELGAVDFVTKPRLDSAGRIEDVAEELTEKVKAAAQAKPRDRFAVTASAEVHARATGPGAPAGAQGQGAARPVHSPSSVFAPTGSPRLASRRNTDRIVALGASTGGTEALAELLSSFPPDAPGTVIAQHIPEVFSARFAARLHAQLPLTVKEAEDGDEILIGHVYVAPGNRHLRIARFGARYVCRVTQDDPVNRHRPSVDVLFRSVAEQAGVNALGALLTGMGADGAEGLGAMANAGAPTIAQDQATSVVWGMPREAIKRGAAKEVLPLNEIGARLLTLARKPVPPQS